ncbi:lipase family protein [Nocardiopsis sp. RSe5-2]|uniref:Lipase family protein n=1 Tax=Nocardiopsis endophytica TaxID=3018445 RepID=A0ABT4UAF8_9ACTN|nr:lipase family protein [Nocardiopsis endophytica]MDA2813928.1 lipase family protein [Nocardiopsis endophytica]
MTTVSFDHTTTEHGPAHARCLAYAAELAYGESEQARRQAAEWGFDRFRFIEADFSPPFALDHTQAYVMASQDMIVVTFRGTEPAQICDWLSDGKAPMVAHPSGKGRVHWGFHTALEAVYPRIREAVEEFRTNGQTLWFAGHSLGGALAMLAAARAHFDDSPLSPDGVYTFGQPRTCDGDLADAYDRALKGRTHRYVNNNDIVPQVPPEPLYEHVDREWYFDADGRLQEKKSMGLLGGMADKAKGYALGAAAFKPGADGLTDHFMSAYLTCVDNAAD